MLHAIASCAPLERATPEDLTSLATDIGSAPMQVGAVLLLDIPSGSDLRKNSDAIGQRIRSVPRLRQRLMPVPFGCGRPVWVDDPDFDIARHVHVVSCPGLGDEKALLGLTAEIMSARLPGDRPLWSATFVSGVKPNKVALIVVFHHVLADGIGGLAVLANLVDGSPTVDPLTFPRAAPSTRRLALDALLGRVRSVAHLKATWRGLVAAVVELRSAKPNRPCRSSLNRPTGGERRLAVVRVDLDQVRVAARAHAATVNDVVLTAVAGALHQLLAARGELVERFVVSIPVSARRETSATELGNQVGVVPVELPATGNRYECLEAIAAVTQAAKRAPRGASAALLGPVFRTLARLGIFHWFVDRQRLVNTFVTNLRGPEARLTFLGAPITDILPVAVITGNVTVSFAVLSYAGTLTVTIIADPDACPDLQLLNDSLDCRLNELLGAEDAPGPGRRARTGRSAQQGQDT